MPRPHRRAGSQGKRGLGPLLAIVLGLQGFAAVADEARPAHALAMHGAPALAEGFERMPYADPAALRGGRLVFGVQGTFDSLNPFVIRGIAAQGLQGYVVQSLMARSLDEPFTLYPQIARAVAADDDRRNVTFHLDPRARFSNGEPVRAADVLATFELLKARGRPNHRSYYRKVLRAEAPDPLTVHFALDGEDRELPLILGLMPVLPASLDTARFEETGFTPLVGSGPYEVAAVDAGRSVTLRRVRDWWGDAVPTARGHFNPDELRFDYYRDGNSLAEAFKAGLYDVRVESDPTRWATGYDGPALSRGEIVRDALPLRVPKGMTGFAFNLRRPVFADARVREALASMLDFDWINRNLFFGAYARSDSYFADSELSAAGRPADDRERELLASFPGAVREDIMAGRWRPGSTDGTGRDRANARAAQDLLAAAGYAPRGGELADGSGRALAFEILVSTRDSERLALAYAGTLARLGVHAEVRLVDEVQYQRRRRSFDYDVILASWPVSPSPGNEQSFRWSSASAAREGSFNFVAAASPATDAMIAEMLRARGREAFVSAVRALDRTLLSGFYVVPLFHLREQWVARRAEVRRPEIVPAFGYAPETWWTTRR